MKKKMPTHTKMYLLLGVLVLIIGVMNVFQLSTIKSSADQKIQDAKEAARPADIEITLLTAPTCTDCNDMNGVVDAIKSANVNIIAEKTIDSNSDEGKEVIEQFSINRVPSIILMGETDKFSSADFTKRGKGLVYESTVPPYKDVTSGKILGLVKATIIKDQSCDACTGIEEVLPQLNALGVTVNAQETVERFSSQGKELIDKYSLKKLPALVLSKDLIDYGSAIEKIFLQTGRKNSDGSYTLEQIKPPYVDVASGKIKGLVTLTVLTDDTCPECYDTEAFNMPILTRFGLNPAKIEKVTIQSPQGAKLVKDYAITLIPTILLSPEIKEYVALAGVWGDVGTVEMDGTYVFRKVDIAGQPYKNLSSNTMINPAAESQ